MSFNRLPTNHWVKAAHLEPGTVLADGLVVSHVVVTPDYVAVTVHDLHPDAVVGVRADTSTEFVSWVNEPIYLPGVN